MARLAKTKAARSRNPPIVVVVKDKVGGGAGSSGPFTVTVRDGLTAADLQVQVERLHRRLKALKALADGTATFKQIKREGYHVNAYDVPPRTVLIVTVPK